MISKLAGAGPMQPSLLVEGGPGTLLAMLRGHKCIVCCRALQSSGPYANLLLQHPIKRNYFGLIQLGPTSWA